MTTEHCDVLIVGAGPVGLLLALMLHKQGVNVRIVERQKALYPLPRAVTLDHEARRLMGTIGLAERLDEVIENVVGKGGEDGTNFVWRDADLKLVADLHFEDPTRSGFPFAAGFSQPEVEGLLEKAVLEREIPLIRGWAVHALEQSAKGVTAKFEKFSTNAATCGNGVVVNGLLANGHGPAQTTATRSDNDLVVHASYVVGCDGANSTVRCLQKFTMTDLGFENQWLIADLLLRDGYVPPIVQRVGSAQVCDPTRPTTIVFAGRGRRRFEFMRLPCETPEELLHEDKMWVLLSKWGYNKDNCYLERKVIYTFKARWANEGFVNRVALAGDALHLMPPFIGQGLNSGFRDAAALAWRLPLMLSGKGNPQKLFESYRNERLPHVEKLTRLCIKLGEAICETDPVKSKQLHSDLRANPLPRVYDPPLGQPGVLTTQPEAGYLSLQRPLKISSDPAAAARLFDSVHGYGWQILNLGAKSAESLLSEEARAFFIDQLNGKCVCISHDEDNEGEYKEWLAQHMAIDHFVLVRPDFYVFGHASAEDINKLVGELQAKITA